MEVQRGMCFPIITHTAGKRPGQDLNADSILPLFGISQGQGLRESSLRVDPSKHLADGVLDPASSKLLLETRPLSH